ncbi:hypothetical protein [Alloalcanivorax gelatiniphagus]|uniref:Uncharacterized protein n=1 Tax=Alloalcanivorax gelatiniphagus TaxID=1194167 RepID=A0ABY2XQV7_9GAMM|nr:hypothetical protein [Alloalcanivorax gelatiniphagus]TMW15291.1 hypothetical protein FGS76_00575 [Alloalcanivorax gelatiniphagus]|tara:strand:- start:7619 stop:7909 length:291 start_codon:yes stop_codon:yes gene_type:complete
MKAIFRSVVEVVEKSLAPVTAHPLLARSLGLILTVALYAGGIAAVLAVSGEARIPALLFGVYFLPAVLRAWLQLYWLVRDDLRGWRRRHGRTGKAF